MSRRKKNYNVTEEDQTYEEILNENLPEEDEDDEEEEVEVVKKSKKKKWSRKKKITVGIVAGISAIGAAFLGGMVTENRRKKRSDDDVSIYNYDHTTVITDDPEVKNYIESKASEVVEEEA